MKPLLTGALLLFASMAWPQQQTAPQLPSGTTPPTFPQPDKDAGREMPPDTRAQAPTSAEVQQQIQTKIDTEPDLAAAALTVKATRNTVILSGTVADESQHRAVRRIAESYAGPRKIVDQIRIKE
jgi:hypothetical protein